MTFMSTKTYPHSVGLSCAFRQWRAKNSHCRFLHGYALQIKIIFQSETLDSRNWVVDFGGLKSFKGMLENTFDHKTLVAMDDPEIEWFRDAHMRGILDLVEVEHTGCEQMAKFIFETAETWLKDNNYDPSAVLVHSVEVAEHDSNSAIYKRT